MYQLKRNDKQIDATLNKANNGIENGTKWPGMSYEAGVEAGIRWVLGEQEENPMEDE